MDPNEHNYYGKLIHSYLKYYGVSFGHGILGTFVWTAAYFCYYFWKEFLITLYRHKANPDEGYIYVLRDFKKNMFRMLGLSIMIAIAFVTLSNHEVLNDKVMTLGWRFFIIPYVCYFLYIYLVKREEFDYFNDLIFFYKYKRGLIRVKTKIE